MAVPDKRSRQITDAPAGQDNAEEQVEVLTALARAARAE